MSASDLPADSPISFRVVTSASGGGEPIRRFEKVEIEVRFLSSAEFDPARLPPEARFDAYDADGDGNAFILDARFRLMLGADQPVLIDGAEQSFVVPCFSMKPGPDAPFEWRVRFAPPLETVGEQFWELSVAGTLTLDGREIPFSSTQTFRFHCAPARFHGPLELNPAGGFYLQQPNRQRGRASRPFFIIGQVTPWAFASGPSATERSRDLLGPMAAAGMNFNYSWMAPWETMLVHRAPTEDWYTGAPDAINPAGPTVQPRPLSLAAGWRSYSYFDQGRADRLDQIIAAHEANDIHGALVIWPHDSLAIHYWKAAESNALNGFSGIPGITLDGFFASSRDPSSEAWLWQKNLYRYIVARYGFARTLGFWFIVAELEGVGSTPFSNDYWRANGAATHAWHDRVAATLRALDYRRRPVTSSTAQFIQNQQDPYGSAREIRDHGDFTGYGERMDLAAFDAYPVVWKSASSGAASDWVNHEQSWGDFCRTTLADAQARIWHYLVGRVCNWTENTKHLPQPKLLSEFGMVEREQPTDPRSVILENQVRACVHFAIWSAFASGHAGTPLKWCDRSRFGSLFPHGTGSFAASRYPDFSTEFAALIALLSDGGPLSNFGELSRRLDGLSIIPARGATATVRAMGIDSKLPELAAVWVFDDDANNFAGRDYAWTDGYGRQHLKRNCCSVHARDQLRVAALYPSATYAVSRYNTWDGGATPDGTFTTDSEGNLLLPVGSFAASTSSRAPLLWDGADVLLILEHQR